VKSGDQHSVRGLLIMVFVPVVVVVGMLASAVLGQDGSTPRPAQPRAAAVAAPALPDEPQAAVAPAPAPVTTTPAQPAGAPPPARERPSEPSEQDASQRPSKRYAPPGTERVDVGHGPQGAAIFRRPGSAGRPGPVVIFLHGWVAIDPQRYGPWIGHLVRDGATVIYPVYQTKPAHDTITPLANVLAGVRAALERVTLAPGRLVAAGHSAGGALAADYAAVAEANGLPAPAAVFSVYPGRKLRHLSLPLPIFDLSLISARTRVLVLAGERDRAVGRGTANQILTGAVNAYATLEVIRDDAVDDHSAPRRYDGAAQRTFWEALDALLAATGLKSADTAAATGRPAATTPP
jgi:acetyl esterase/lipase